MKKVRLLIIIIIILLCCIIGLFIYFNKSNNATNSSDNNTSAKNAKNETAENNLDYEIVNRKADTNQVAPVLSKDEYFKNISYNTYFAISNCISANYQNNVIINIKSIIVDKVNSYTVNAIEMNDNYEYKKDKFYIVNLDYANSTFSIEDVTARYQNFDDIQVAKVDNIVETSNNKYVQRNYSDEYKYKQIFENMKRLMLAKPKLAYSYLDSDYRNKRFGSYENFENYINNNREHLISITPKDFKTNDDKTVVKLKDQYSNWYEFKISNTMQYTAKIDKYIVMLDEEATEYSKLNDKDKVKFCIKRWISMLNKKEYGLAYNFLDETFKEENYSTLEKFKKTIEQKYPDKYNKIAIQLKEEGNVYIAEVKMEVDGEEFTDKYMTIIIKLGNDTDFTLSFDKQ